MTFYREGTSSKLGLLPLTFADTDYQVKVTKTEELSEKLPQKNLPQLCVIQ